MIISLIKKLNGLLIKNYNKILLILLAVFGGLPLLVTLVLMIPGIQTRIVETVTQRLSKDLDTEITIGRVQALPFSGIRLNDFLMLDQQKDTLFYASKVHSEIDYFSFFKKHLYIGKVTFDGPEFHLIEHDEEMNFTFLIDSIGNISPDSTKWHYSVRGISIKNGSLSFSHSLLKNPSFKKDHLLFSELNIDLTRTSGVNDSLNFKLEKFSLTEQNGITIESGNAKGKIRPENISIDDLFLKSAGSQIRIDKLQLPINPGKDINKSDLRFEAIINKIIISPYELSLYLKNTPNLDRPIGLSGNIEGSLKNLKGRNILMSWGKDTRMRTSFDLTDISNFSETFIFMDVENLRTTPTDIEKIIDLSESGSLKPALSNLEIIQYSGNLTGFVSDLVAYGTFNTALGSINTDIGIKLSEDKSISYSGALSTQGFQINEAFNMGDKMGKLSMNLQLNGSFINRKNYFTYLMGSIDELEWNQYTYRDASINGLFTHQRFDGSVAIADPNGTFRFDGEIDASGKMPVLQFKADFENVMPDRLNILPQLKDGVVTMSVEANFTGNNIDNLAGEINILEGLIFTPQNSMEIDRFSLRAFKKEGIKKIEVNSDFVDGQISGDYHFNKIRASFLNMVSHFLPSLAAKNPDSSLPPNRFGFDFNFKGFDKVLRLLYPGLEMAYEGAIHGRVDSEEHLFNVDANFESIRYQNSEGKNIEFHAHTNGASQMEIITRAEEISHNNMLSLYNFSVHHKASRDTLDMNVFWNNWGEITNSGALYTKTAFKRDKNNQFYSNTLLQPSTVILKDSIWQISEAKALYTPKSFSIQGLGISHSEQRLAVNGFLHRESMDGMRLEMHNIDLSQLFGKNSKAPHHFGGIIDGSLEIQEYYRNPLWSANFSVDKLSFNNDTIGFFTVGSRWDPKEDALAITTSVMKGKNTPLKGEGYLNPRENKVDLELNLDGFNTSFLRTFIGNILQNFEADASGKLFVTGPIQKPYLTGKINVDKGTFDVDLLQTSYEIKDSVWFYPNEIRFKDLTITDKHGKQGLFKGSIYHNAFANMVYNLQMNVNQMLVLNTRLRNNPYYYGTVYANGNLLVSGTKKNVELNISGQTLENTRFFIPMADTEEAVQSNFIQFVTNDQKTVGRALNKNETTEYNVDLTGLQVNMEIDITPQARIEIIFDSATGDLLSTAGNGNIQIQIDRQGNVNFFGDYAIERGEYLFSLQNLVNKKFAINSGGTVNWQGNPYDAQIDLTAVYKLKASLSDLIGPMAGSASGDQNDIQRRIPIHCNLMLKGPLEKPGIKFAIKAPTLNKSRESYILDFIATEDEMNRQVLSLLVLNRFYTPDYLRMGSEQGVQTNNAALVTTTEMLSNQLSRWLSNISRDVDVGVNYRPEDNISSEEIELALSTQMFNDRVSINGNVGYGKYQTNTSKMVGDFDMDVKLNPSGTIRTKAYTRSNDDIIYETSPTTQGIGISFREEFNKITELLHRYWQAIRGKQQPNIETEE